MSNKGDRIVGGGADKLDALADRAAEPGAGLRRSPGGPQLEPRRRKAAKLGPNPFVVAGAAFGLGTLLAKLIDWRGHAHPRR